MFVEKETASKNTFETAPYQLKFTLYFYFFVQPLVQLLLAGTAPL